MSEVAYVDPALMECVTDLLARRGGAATAPGAPTA